MALNIFELFGKIAIDSSGAESGLDNTVRHAKKAESSLSKTFKKIGGMLVAAFSVNAIVDFGKQCTQAYANIAAEESAFAQIMGDYADTAQKKLDAVAESTGVTSTRMTGAMTSLTAKFKGLGYDVDDATTLASDGLLIAADAAAFWDMSLEDSMSHLNSFINGSYEGGEAIGLFANDTQMAAFAIEQGIVADTKAWAALDEAQRQATRLLYAKNMMEASGATGQAAKESEAYANVMANLKESWRQFQGVIGKPILEKVVLPAMQKLNNFLPKLTESVSNGIVWMEEGFDKIKSYFDEVFTEDGINIDALPDALTNMFRDLGRSVGRRLSEFGHTLRNGWNNNVWPLVQRTFKATFGIDVPSWGEIETTITNWWDGGNGIAQAIADACNWTLNLFGAPANVTAEEVKSTLSEWWTNTRAFVQNTCTWVLKLFNNPEEAAEDVADAIAPWWAKVVTALEDACEWTLNLFTKPEATDEDVEKVVSDWWATKVAVVQAACNWTLNLFKTPPDVKKEDVASTLDAWWAPVSVYVQDACAWMLNAFDAPADLTAENVENKLSSWWSKAVTQVQDACSWTLKLFQTPTDDAEDINTTMSGWWNAVKETVEGVCEWGLKLFANVKATEDDVKEKIDEWWVTAKEIVEGACNWALGLFNLPTTEEAKEKIINWWNEVVNDLGLTFLAIPDSAESYNSKKPAGSATIDLPGNGDSDGVDTELKGPYDPTINYIQNRHRVIDGLGGSAGGGGGAPTLAAQIQALTESVQALVGELPGAISAGIGDITITGNIDTGNVMLNTGTLVGHLAPRVNLVLGSKMRLAERISG